MSNIEYPANFTLLIIIHNSQYKIFRVAEELILIITTLSSKIYVFVLQYLCHNS